jgi:hypothetical protein
MVDAGNMFEVVESPTNVVYRKFVIEFIIAVAAEAVEVKFVGDSTTSNMFPASTMLTTQAVKSH